MNIICALKDLYSYLTTWNITLLILLNLGYLKDYYYDILFISIFISCCSFIFTYIYPKQMFIKIDNYKFLLKGKELIIFDLIFHHIPLILIFNKKNMFKINKTYLFVLIPLIYKILLNDNYERYGLTNETIFILYFFVFILYLYFIF